MQAQASCPSQKYSSLYISDCPNLSLRLERMYLAKYSLRGFRERHRDRTNARACTRAFPHSTSMDGNRRTSCDGRAERAISCYSESKERGNEVSRYIGIYKLQIPYEGPVHVPPIAAPWTTSQKEPGWTEVWKVAVQVESMLLMATNPIEPATLNRLVMERQ